MNEAELRDLLRKASRAEQPTDAFVASLWSELESVTEDKPDPRQNGRLMANATSNRVTNPEKAGLSTRREPVNVRSGPVAALAAAAAVLLIGALAVLLAPLSGPERIASAPAPTEPTKEAPLVTMGVQRDQSESAIVKKCDRLMVDTRVSAVMRPGVVAEATSYRPAGSVATDVSAIELRSLVQAIEQLGQTDEIREDVRVRHTLTSATGALDQAILLIEMGEPTLAHESIDQAKMALGELASEAALDGCLATVS